MVSRVVLVVMLGGKAHGSEDRGRAHWYPRKRS
jgi:hypothetical protein